MRPRTVFARPLLRGDRAVRAGAAVEADGGHLARGDAASGLLAAGAMQAGRPAEEVGSTCSGKTAAGRHERCLVLRDHRREKGRAEVGGVPFPGPGELPTPWSPTQAIWFNSSTRSAWPCSIRILATSCQSGRSLPPRWPWRESPPRLSSGGESGRTSSSVGSGTWECSCR